MIEKLVQGRERAIYVYGSCEDYRDWAEGLSRPPAALLAAKVERLADLSLLQLQRCHGLWKHVSNSKPKLFEIRIDQARLYCCLWGNDIVILNWAVKKQNKADPALLKQAERRAKEVLGVEESDEAMAGGTSADAGVQSGKPDHSAHRKMRG